MVRWSIDCCPYSRNHPSSHVIPVPCNTVSSPPFHVLIPIMFWTCFDSHLFFPFLCLCLVNSKTARRDWSEFPRPGKMWNKAWAVFTGRGRSVLSFLQLGKGRDHLKRRTCAKNSTWLLDQLCCQAFPKSWCSSEPRLQKATLLV